MPTTRPDLEHLLEMLGPMDSIEIEELRAEADSAPPYSRPIDITWEEVDAGGVPAEWSIPDDCEPDRVVLYTHGGGYATGSVALNRGLCADLARACRARLLSVDYRLAPEHPFPAALDDALSAFRYLRSHGVDPAKLVMAGDSAGAGLAIGAQIALRDAGEGLPAASVCLSPWFDMTLSNPAIETLADVDPMVNRPLLETFRDAYLNGADPRTPTASPLHADLQGLPPILLQVGRAEVLLGETEEFAKRATAAGVRVDFEAWDDMVHVWHFFVDQLPEARQAIEHVGRFVDRQLGGASSPRDGRLDE